eukprot:636484-Rhodomonas_salina.2
MGEREGGGAEQASERERHRVAPRPLHPETRRGSTLHLSTPCARSTMLMFQVLARAASRLDDLICMMRIRTLTFGKFRLGYRGTEP